MKKFNIKYLVVTSMFFTLIVLTSCKDWLTVAPEDSLIKEKFWTKTADVDGALAATYNAMRDVSLNSLIMGEVRADLVNFTGNSFSGYARIGESDITPTNNNVGWSNYYKPINMANTLMYYDKQVLELDKTFTEEYMNQVDAEALYIRSLSYFYLIRLWKDVPLVINASISDTSDLFVPKSPEKVVIKQVISDLERAKNMAYTTEFMGTDYFYGRANRYSILALLADVYLWDEQYQKCIEACDEIINSGLYDLETNETFFNIYYPGNSGVESIMEFQYNDDLESQDNPIYGQLIPPDPGSPQCEIDANKLNLIMNTEDPRRFQGKGATWKYAGKDAFGLIPRTNNERSANWIIHRYADVLLMKAEAEIELDNYGEANTYIRATLDRVGMPYQEVYIKEDLRQALLDEKGREFLLEGKRWFDLLRAAKRDNFANKQIIIEMILSGADVKQQAILKTKVYDTLSYYLPVLQRELDYNQNLVQNPYYDR